MQNSPIRTNQKDPNNRGLDESETLPEQIITLWCVIANDYRTLIGLEDVNVVEIYVDSYEEEDDE
jgi:hypothetical protein